MKMSTYIQTVCALYTELNVDALSPRKGATDEELFAQCDGCRETAQYLTEFEGVDGDGELRSAYLCRDCACYIANGDLPSHLEPDDEEPPRDPLHQLLAALVETLSTENYSLNSDHRILLMLAARALERSGPPFEHPTVRAITSMTYSDAVAIARDHILHKHREVKFSVPLAWKALKAATEDAAGRTLCQMYKDANGDNHAVISILSGVSPDIPKEEDHAAHNQEP